LATQLLNRPGGIKNLPNAKSFAENPPPERKVQYENNIEKVPSKHGPRIIRYGLILLLTTWKSAR
jgi:hypothetical protein